MLTQCMKQKSLQGVEKNISTFSLKNNQELPENSFKKGKFKHCNSLVHIDPSYRNNPLLIFPAFICFPSKLTDTPTHTLLRYHQLELRFYMREPLF